MFDVTSISADAFEGYASLASITSHIPAEKLFAIEATAFANTDKANCILYVPVGAKDTYSATAGWSDFANIVELEPVTEVTITIDEHGSATYCSPYALDFSDVDDIKAYTAAGYDADSETVTLLRIFSPKENTGLFLKGEPGVYVVPVVESSNYHSLNMLVGTLRETAVNSISDDGVYANFEYDAENSMSRFSRIEDSSTMHANTAYLQIPVAWLSSPALRSVSVRFDEGETPGSDGDDTTAVGDVETRNEKAEIFDLAGRKIDEITEKGIYIIDGKRVFVK